MSSFNETPPTATAAAAAAAAAREQQWGEGSTSSGLALNTDMVISPYSEGSPNSSYPWPISPDDSSGDSRHGSSPEADLLLGTSAKTPKAGRTPSRYDWSKHRPTIKRLYIDEDKTLKEMLEIMQREHNFIAT